MRLKRIIIAPIAVAALVGAGVIAAQALTLRIAPNLDAIVPNTICLQGFAASPTIVGESQIYTCTSQPLVCNQGWVPGGARAESIPGAGWRFVYGCTPSSMVPR